MTAVPVVVRRARVGSRAVSAVWIAVVLWSTTALFVRAAHADALVFTTYRLWLALPPLALVIGFRARRGVTVVTRAPGISRLRWTLVVLGAGFFFASGAFTAFAALNRTRLLDVTLIGALQPVLVIAIGVSFLGEHAARSHVVRALVAVGGTAAVALSASGSGSWDVTGEVLAVASLFLNVGWYVYGRVLRDRYAVDPFVFMFGVLAAAAVITTPVAWIGTGGLDLPPAAIGFATATMIAGTAAHLLVVWAHRYVPASMSAPLLLGEPILVAVGAWICFAEALGPAEILASLVVVGALWGMVRSPAFAHAEGETADPAPPA